MEEIEGRYINPYTDYGFNYIKPLMSSLQNLGVTIDV